MSLTMTITIVSVLIGFLLFGGAFASFSYKKSPALTWSLFGASLVFTTVIPVILALTVAI